MSSENGISCESSIVESTKKIISNSNFHKKRSSSAQSHNQQEEDSIDLPSQPRVNQQPVVQKLGMAGPPKQLNKSEIRMRSNDPSDRPRVAIKTTSQQETKQSRVITKPQLIVKKGQI